MNFKKKNYIPFSKSQYRIIHSLVLEWTKYISPQNNYNKNKQLAKFEEIFRVYSDKIVELSITDLILIKDWAIGRRDNLNSEKMRGSKDVDSQLQEIKDLIEYLKSNIIY